MGICRRNRPIHPAAVRTARHHLIWRKAHAVDRQAQGGQRLCDCPRRYDKHALQHALYLAIVADVPVNLTLYTVQEWDALTQDEDSYAAWIRRKGRVLYEQIT